MPYDASDERGKRTPKVQVIIVTYNSSGTLQDCVKFLEAQTFSDFEAVIWDNDSDDGSIKNLTAGPRFRTMTCNKNLGFAAGNNRAAALSSSPYIAFLNPDAFPNHDWLERLVEAADATGAEAVASLQLDDADIRVLDGAGDCMSIAGIPWRGGYGQARAAAPTTRCEVFSACGAAALYRRDAFEALGGFDERFFCYCEDVDLGFRLRRAGGRCLLEPKAVVRHVGGVSSGGRRSDFAEFYGTRNRLWAFVRNMPLWLMPIALPAHILTLVYVLARSPSLLGIRLSALAQAFRHPVMFRAPPTKTRTSPMALARSLSWSPLALSRRSVVSRPWRDRPGLIAEA